jgi:hypothetical protein
MEFILSSAPYAPVTEGMTHQGTLQYLGVTIYGPRRRLSEVGDVMTQIGCYLNDPVGCDRNVPYVNPQCLFSLHEQPPMTFDLVQMQRTGASLDVLAGFETSDSFELAASPIALHTELKRRAPRPGVGKPTNLELQASATSPYFLFATGAGYASKQRWYWYMAAEYKRQTAYVRMP